jgi:hypothetical protein
VDKKSKTTRVTYPAVEKEDLQPELPAMPAVDPSKHRSLKRKKP